MLCDHCVRLCVVCFIGCLVISALITKQPMEHTKIASDIKLVFHSSTDNNKFLYMNTQAHLTYLSELFLAREVLHRKVV